MTGPQSIHPRITPDEAWRVQAACRDHPNGDQLFFPPGPDPDYEPAKAVCRRCPVMADCLTHALAAGERHGCWGGRTPKERERIARRRRLLNPPLPDTNMAR